MSAASPPSPGPTARPARDPVVGRFLHLKSCARDPLLRSAEWAVCAGDVVHWLATWGWTLDPREAALGRPAVLPFVPFPHQVEFLRWLEERERLQEHGIAEKSREVGLTWLCVAFALHRWLFRPGYQVGFGSYKLLRVDHLGDPNSVFAKARFLLDHLPSWMLPAGFDRKRHDCLAKLVNPANGSAIIGEGGDDIGRGGRAAVYFVDEAAHLERPKLVDAALAQTTRVRIDVSTPCGPGNPFAQKRFSGNFPVFTFHWTQDPRKDRAWYEAECRKLGDPALIAQELDIDHSASLEGIVIPGAWVRAAVNLDLPRSGRCACGLDVAEAGSALSVLVPRWGPFVGDPVSWGQANTTETAHRAAEHCRRFEAAVLSYDVAGVGAGVRGALAAFEGRLPFYCNAVNGGSSPTEAVWPDRRTSRERFLNLRAELWWGLRARFERTYEHVTQGVLHGPEEMISLPDCPQLIAELSLPTYSLTETGKVKIEAKDAMRRRGVKSPDFADALATSFAVPPPPGRPAAGGARPTAVGVPGPYRGGGYGARGGTGYGPRG
jgi:phage terminase large subunit